MREIKFRAWDNWYKKMIICDDLYWFSENGVYTSKSNVENPQYIIEQFTGLFDKYGKEIYEGDIVYYFPGYTVIPSIMQVEYNGGYFEPFFEKYVDDFGNIQVNIMKPIDFTIIGNIHEAPSCK